MKYITILILLSTLVLAQEKADSLQLKEMEKDFKFIQKEYAKTDSLQIKRLGIMEYIQEKYLEKVNAVEKKKAKKD